MGVWPWRSWTCPLNLWGAKAPQWSLQTPTNQPPFIDKCDTFRFSLSSFLAFLATLWSGFVAMSLVGLSTSLVGVFHQSTDTKSILTITQRPHTLLWPRFYTNSSWSLQSNPVIYKTIRLHYNRPDLILQVLSFSQKNGIFSDRFGIFFFFTNNFQENMPDEIRP